MSFTGEWILDQKQSDSQCKVLKAMGRPQWQSKIIDKTSEVFRIVALRKRQNCQYVYQTLIDADIELQGNIINWLSVIYDLRHVHFVHEMQSNGTPQDHENDEKGFGPCRSITTWYQEHPEYKTRGFNINWIFQNGDHLDVYHTLENRNKLKLLWKYQKQTGRQQVWRATKYYNRVQANIKLTQTFKNIKNNFVEKHGRSFNVV